MISERQFANGFSSFWGELLPLLTPSCVTIFNESHARSVGNGRYVDEDLSGDVTNLDLDVLAESAFRLAEIAQSRSELGVALVNDSAALTEAWDWAQGRISRHRTLSRRAAPTEGSTEFAYLRAAAVAYDDFHRDFESRGLIHYSPKVQGCGFLHESQADVAIGDTLFEVKMVSRGFGSKDIKQLIIYLALDHCSGDARWRRAGLFNPRRRRVALFDPNQFLFYVSGGESAVSVYREIESFLLSRDMQIEKQF